MQPNDPAGLTWTPYTAADLAAWVQLLESIADADHLPERWDLEGLAEEFADPQLDVERDTMLGRSAEGEPVAFSVVTELAGATLRRINLWGGVAPAYRGRGIGTALLGFQREQAGRLATLKADADPTLTGRELMISLDYPDGNEPRRRLAAGAGFHEIRRFYELERPLPPRGADLTPATPADPTSATPADGVVVRNWQPDDDEPVRHLHNRAFAGHFFSEPCQAEAWQTWTTGHRSFRRDWSKVAERDGRLVGYLAGHAHEVDWPALGHTQGWIGLVGVEQDQRGTGLATALLGASMQAMTDSGMDAAGLEVDTGNPTGALDLYTSLGFEQRQCFVKAALA